MLCPECRRMVGKDGYCPQGHLARPELAEKALPALRPLSPPVPPPDRTDDATPAGLGPSNPPPQGMPNLSLPGAPVPPGAAPTEAMAPSGPPMLPPEYPHVGPIGPPRKRRRAAFVATPAVLVAALLAFLLFGGRAGASNLKIVFTQGETHHYRMEVTMTGRGGNLSGGFEADVSVGADLIQTTGAVDKDGAATIMYTLKNFSYSEDGRRASPPPGAGAAFSVKVRPDGTVLDLKGGNAFGLEKVNPAGQYLNPANARPLLPDRKIEPGESWKVKVKQAIPDVGTLSAEAENTLDERKRIDGNDAVVIRSRVNVPLNIHIGHDALAKQAQQNGASGSDVPRNAAISMLGSMKLNLTQTIFTANGLLQSALGDGVMRGTMTIEGIPGSGPLSFVFDMKIYMTVTKTSTGQSA